MRPARELDEGAATLGGVPVVLVVEDRRLLAESLSSVLVDSGLEVAMVEEPSLDAVLAAIEAGKPSVAIVAVGFGQGPLTEQVIGVLCERGIPTLVMTGGVDRLRLARCVAEGAVGILDKSMDIETVIRVIRDADGNRSALSQTERYALMDQLRAHRQQLVAARRPLEYLTGREREVLAALCRGLRAADIARTSFVALSTVRSQIKSILAKLGVRSQVQAIALATRSHWFDTPVDD